MYQQRIKIFLAAALVSLFIVPVVAQESEKIVRPAQITFVTPLGTNGASSSETINHFSVNMLWGASAGVSGAEAGGILNQTNGHITGFQGAGLANITTGKITGAQAAGLLNTNSTGFRGAQMAGLINVVSTGTGENESLISSSTGAQASGLINFHGGEMNGFQAAGFPNVQGGAFEGVQVSGFANKSNDLKGVQAAGFINIARNVSGVQIGLINIADTIGNGVPVGLFSFVKKGGYSVVEIESNESFYANVNYKLGVQRLYTIFSLAFEEQNGKKFWAPGFGFGTYMPVGSKTGINIDGISYNINENKWWTDELNQLNKLKINGSYQLARRLNVYGGVSINVLVTKLSDNEDDPNRRLFKTPDPWFDDVSGRTHVLIYPGFNAGLRF